MPSTLPYLQILPSNTQAKIYKRVYFLTTLGRRLYNINSKEYEEIY